MARFTFNIFGNELVRITGRSKSSGSFLKLATCIILRYFFSGSSSNAVLKVNKPLGFARMCRMATRPSSGFHTIFHNPWCRLRRRLHPVDQLIGL
jgi:hypothetical protein